MLRSYLFFLILFSTLLTSCGTSRRVLIRDSNPSKKEEVTDRPGKDEKIRRNIVDYARSFIGTKYKTNGRTPAGFDCSGLTVYVFRKHSVQLDATSQGQSKMGSRVDIKDVAPGDLVFFGIDRIHHVGIVSRATNKELFMIHSSTSQGVIETAIFDSGYWSKRLRFARRVL